MQLSAEKRNAQIYALLARFIKEAKTRKTISYPVPFTRDEVEALFVSHIWGHREITLTILLARLVDPTFKASEDFYKCHPRSIYEQPIRTLLRNNKIPHKKSGPLNVAKNSQKIDAVWAHNKRGDGMALVVAGLVTKIESVSKARLQRFTLAYVQRYLLEASRVAKLKSKVRTIEDPLFLFRLCRDLIVNVPDGGTTPQTIVGTLIESLNSVNGSTVKVSGGSDSVSTTNTTSKKPGDVMEELPNSAKRVYEVTVKKFSADRMRESHEAIKAWDKNEDITEVIVICRAEDVPTEAIKEQSSSYLQGVAKNEDLTYYFVDIFAWIQEKLLSLTPAGRMKFHTDLTMHVNQINTSEKVKRYFTEWHRAPLR